MCGDLTWRCIEAIDGMPTTKFIRHVWCLHHLLNLFAQLNQFMKIVCMQSTFFLSNVSTMQLSKTTCNFLNYINMYNMKNTTLKSKKQSRTRWIRKQNVTFQSVINFYKQLCFINWVTIYLETLTTILCNILIYSWHVRENYIHFLSKSSRDSWIKCSKFHVWIACYGPSFMTP